MESLRYVHALVKCNLPTSPGVKEQVLCIEKLLFVLLSDDGDDDTFHIGHHNSVIDYSYVIANALMEKVLPSLEVFCLSIEGGSDFAPLPRPSRSMLEILKTTKHFPIPPFATLQQHNSRMFTRVICSSNRRHRRSWGRGRWQIF